MKSSRAVWRWWLGVALTGALLLGAATAWAQTGGGFDLGWLTIDGGGDTVTGGGYTLMGSFGQPEAVSQSGGGYTLEGGFWPGAMAADSPPQSRVFLPLIQR